MDHLTPATVTRWRSARRCSTGGLPPVQRLFALAAEEDDQPRSARDRTRSWGGKAQSARLMTPALARLTMLRLFVPGPTSAADSPAKADAQRKQRTRSTAETGAWALLDRKGGFLTQQDTVIRLVSEQLARAIEDRVGSAMATERLPSPSPPRAEALRRPGRETIVAALLP